MTKTKKKKIQILCVLALLGFICLWFVLGLVYALVIGVVGLLFLILNLYAKKRIAWNADHMFTDVDRNYDYLLIGEPWNYKGEIKGKVISFFFPNHSMLASYELTRRLFSLLKEGTGTLVISCKEEYLDSKAISVLDIPYLHETQQHKYGIRHAKLKTYLPFMFAPLATLRYFLSANNMKAEEVSLDDYHRIAEFCKVRNIKLEIIKTK